MRRHHPPRLGQTLDFVASQRNGDLAHGSEVPVAPAVCSNVNVLDDTASSLLDVLSQDNLGNSPLDHNVETSNNHFNTSGVRVAKELDPRSTVIILSVLPPHLN